MPKNTRSLSYRIEPARTIASWCQSKASGALIGMAGSGKSNLLNHYCDNPEVFTQFLPKDFPPVAFVTVDLNSLTAKNDLSEFYRLILRSFSESKYSLPSIFQKSAESIFQENISIKDAFVVQSALRKFFIDLKEEEIFTVLIFDQFDDFCRELDTESLGILSNLRSLRDSFKESLIYIFGMRNEIIYWEDSYILGELREIFDSHTCWIGAMAESDAHEEIKRIVRSRKITQRDINTILELSGSYAAWIKVICDWWANNIYKKTSIEHPEPNMNEWILRLLNEKDVLIRLDEVWSELTQVERLLLSKIDRAQSLSSSPHYSKAFQKLVEKGLCVELDSSWAIRGKLFASFIQSEARVGKGRIELKGDQVFQGGTLLITLAGKELDVMNLLFENINEVVTKDEIAEYCWESEASEANIQQVISNLRKKIEPIPSAPSYIVTSHGKGYALYPEGRGGPSRKKL